MRIAILHVTMSLLSRGSENYAWNHAKWLVENNHQVKVFLGKNKNPIIKHQNVAVAPSLYLPRRLVPNLGSRFRKLIERVSHGAFSLAKILSFRPEVIIIHKPYDIPIALLVKKISRSKIVWRCHGKDFYPGLKRLLEKVDLIFCVSKRARDLLHEDYPDITASVIHTGVDKDFFNPSLQSADNSKCILYFGSLEGWKGVHHLLNAFASIDAPSYTLWIVGEGPEKEKLISLTDTLNISQRVLFSPQIHNREDIRKVIASAEIIVFPSLANETFSNAVLEAMSMAKPIIASNAGGFPEAITHETDGILFSPGNANELSCAIRRLIENPNLRSLLGKNARSTILERFASDESFRRVEAALLGIL